MWLHPRHNRGTRWGAAGQGSLRPRRRVRAEARGGVNTQSSCPRLVGAWDPCPVSEATDLGCMRRGRVSQTPRVIPELISHGCPL